jgi:hypothetical protein
LEKVKQEEQIRMEFDDGEDKFADEFEECQAVAGFKKFK